MAKLKLNEIVKLEIRKFLFEKFISELLPVGHPSNLHGDERTQRQFVIDLASKNAMGIISISDIADALDTTRDQVQSYSRRMYLDSHRADDDFIKLVDEVPFQSAAIYQLISRAKSAPLSKQQIDVVKREEEKKYDATAGEYYSIYFWSKNNVNPITVGYLNLRDDEDVRKYQKLMPKQQNIYGDIYNYRISDKKMTRPPKDAKPENIITPENFEAFIKKEFEDE